MAKTSVERKEAYLKKMDALRWKVVRGDELTEGERHWISALIESAASTHGFTWFSFSRECEGE